MIKNKKKKIVGIFIIVLNTIWFSLFGYLFVAYRKSGILWFFMYPDWLILINLLVALSGIIIGEMLIKDKIEVKQALVIDIPLMVFSLLLSYIFPMIGLG